jgi:hypothetical protein
MIMPALFSSASDEWPTPQAFFDKLNRRYRFTLDPCATPENAKCPIYFTKADDGLKQIGERIGCSAIRLMAEQWGRGRRSALRRHRAGRSWSC